MKNLLNKQKYFLIFIFIIAFSLRIGYAFLEKITSVGNDSYDEIGKYIAQGKGYRMSDGPIENDNAVLWPPGYAFFLGIIYMIFGHSHPTVWIMQSIIGAFVCVLIFFIGNRLFDHRVACISAVISAICFNLVIYSAMLYSETVFLFLLLLCFIYFYKADALNQNLKYSLSGILAGLSVLTRPIILAPFLFFSLITFKKNIKGAILFLFPVVLFISLWIARNYYIYKHLIPICSGMGEIFWDGHHLKANGEYTMPEGVPDNLPIQEYIKIDNLGYLKGLGFITKYPIKTAFLELRKFSLFFSLVRTDAWWPHIKGIDRIFSFTLSLLSNLLIFGLGIIGIVFSYTKACKYISWTRRFIYIYILSLMPFVVAARYRLTVYPFMIIFSAYAITVLKEIKFAFEVKDAKTFRYLKICVILIAIILLNTFYDFVTNFSLVITKTKLLF